jgi:hypothetical protein
VVARKELDPVARERLETNVVSSICGELPRDQHVSPSVEWICQYITLSGVGVGNKASSHIKQT